MDQYIHRQIDDRQGRINDGHVDENDLLSLYMNVTDERGSPLSRKQVRDAVINLLLAGRYVQTSSTLLSERWGGAARFSRRGMLKRVSFHSDSTAQALSWTFYS